MADARHVHIVDDVPEIDTTGAGPVMLVCLEGFLDAGNASALTIGQITDDTEGRVVASFDVDEFYDYRARRPPMSFLEDHYGDYEAPRLVVRSVTDAAGTAYLLLTGPEPDARWEAFTRAVRAVVEHFRVRLVVAVGAVPMAVPHTRPVQVTNHATSQRLLVQENVWKGEIRVPSSAVSLLEVRLGEWGHDACGFVAHIPHYVAQFDYPDAAVALLEGIESVTGLTWDTTELHAAGDTKRADIARQIDENAEVRSVVTALEQQYDAFHSQRVNLLGASGELPSGEEIGAEFEQFLAGLDQTEED